MEREKGFWWKLVVFIFVGFLLISGAFAGGYFVRDYFIKKIEKEKERKEKFSTGILQISSYPSGLEIFIDGVRKNVRTPSKIVLSVGSHRILLASEDVFGWETEVEIKKGATVILKAFAVSRSEVEGAEEEGTRELAEAEAMLNAFMRYRIKGNAEASLRYLTGSARTKYAPSKSKVLMGLSSPKYSRYTILSRKQIKEGVFKFKVRIYENLLGGEEAGYFDEIIVVVREGRRYRIDSIEGNPHTS